MFESYLADLLVPYLGHFLDISPESLRVSLFSGERNERECAMGFILREEL